MDHPPKQPQPINQPNEQQNPQPTDSKVSQTWEPNFKILKKFQNPKSVECKVIHKTHSYCSLFKKKKNWFYTQAKNVFVWHFDRI